MNRYMKRSGRARVDKPSRAVVLESLESRRLLTTIVSLSGTVLTISENVAHVHNETTVKLVNGGTAIEVDSNQHNVNIDNSTGNAGWTVSNDLTSATGPITGITGIQMDTGDGNDDYSIPSMSVPVMIQPSGGGSVQLDVGSDAQDTAQSVTQPITFNATNATSALLVVLDNGNTQNVDPTLTSTSILGPAAAPINFTPADSGAGGSPNITVDCQTGPGSNNFVLQQDPTNPSKITYKVESYGRGSTGVQTLNANSSLDASTQGSGSELLRIGSLGLVSGVKGTVTGDFFSGPGSIIVNDSADAAAHTFDVNFNGRYLARSTKTDAQVVSWNGSLCADAADGNGRKTRSG